MDTTINERIESDVRWIVNTSAEDGIQSVRKCNDLDVLREALRRETGGDRCTKFPPRKGLTAVLQSRIRRLEKEVGR